MAANRRARALSSATFVTALAFSPAAFADPPGAADAATAEYVFHEAVDAFAAGRFHSAIDLFTTADRLRPRPELAFDIARSYEKLSNDSGALRYYREYLRRAGRPADAPEVERRIAWLESRLAQRGVQQARFESNPPGAIVKVDGENIGVTPVTDDLRPGPHRVTLHLDGFADVEKELAIPAQKSTDFAFVLTSPATPVPHAPAPPPVKGAEAPAATADPNRDRETHHDSLTTLGWIGLGTAGAAFASALVFEVLRKNAEDDAAKQPEQIKFQQDVHAMESDRTAARVLVGVGAAAAITGGVLLVLGANASQEQEHPTVSVGVTPTSLFTTASMRF